MLEEQKGGPVTSLDRGKMLNRALMESLDKLRPPGPEPKADLVPPREWSHFIVINDSYVRDEPTRDVMARLCIGEGTFNRTRRRAVRAIAKALSEVEQKARSSHSPALKSP